jgi:hypothetical protein
VASQEDLEAPKKQEAPGPPLTSQGFIDRVNQLIEEGKAAGLRPGHLLIGICVKQGIGAAQMFLAALEGDSSPVGKK